MGPKPGGGHAHERMADAGAEPRAGRHGGQADECQVGIDWQLAADKALRDIYDLLVCGVLVRLDGGGGVRGNLLIKIGM